MKYGVIERAMWAVFKGGLKREVENTLRVADSARVMSAAHVAYRKMLESVQEFHPRTRFVSNIIIASMVGAVYLSLDDKPSVDDMTVFVRESLMNNRAMRKFVISEKNYTKKGQRALADGAKLSESDFNPYSWRYRFEPGSSLMEYTAYFTSCGICYLYEQWGISEITPAMCRLDYDMAHANNTEFLREQTLYDGGEYCDCHYIHTPPSR